MIQEICTIPEGRSILLHACAHIVPGMDPTLEQWKELSDLVKQRKLVPFFDLPYQEFVLGDATFDAAVLRMFVEYGT